MKLLNLTAAHASAVGSLGLDPTLLDLTSIEAIACALRRAAGMLCPCSERTLLEAVTSSMKGIVDESINIRDAVSDTLESIIANGDLFEASAQNTDRPEKASVLYLVPPAFVRRNSGAFLVLGVLPDGVSPLPNDLSATIEHVNHMRILPPGANDNLGETLIGLGFFEITSETWLKSPVMESVSSYLQRINALLSAAPESPRFPGLQILDPQKPVRYYPDRWTELNGQPGRFIARRPQTYGSPIWCYVQSSGDTIRMIDFPLRSSPWRGCDEALRLQAAIDHERGHPQVYRVRPGPPTTRILELFSPIPKWSRRRLEAIGEPVSSTNCLVSYKFRAAEIAEEQTFLTDYLWLVQDS
jgi:hypothetical protein